MSTNPSSRKNASKRLDLKISEATSVLQQISNTAESIRIKLITLGSVQVGKSCLVKKYCERNRFASLYSPTVGVDYGVKTVTRSMEDGSSVSIKIDFFDLSGDQNYRDVRDEFFNNVDGVMLVYDVTDERSFVSLSSWIEEACQFGVSASNSVLVVVGNKIDQYPRMVTEQQGTSFAAENNAAYFETSAKSGAYIEDAFDFILRETCKNGYYK